MVRQTLTTLAPKVLAGRMVREYVERLYAPAARAHRVLDSATARDLSTWKTRVRDAWPHAAVDHGETQLTPPPPRHPPPHPPPRGVAPHGRRPPPPPGRGRPGRPHPRRGRVPAGGGPRRR